MYKIVGRPTRRGPPVNDLDFNYFQQKKYLFCIISGLGQVRIISGPSAAARTDLPFLQFSTKLVYILGYVGLRHFLGG